MKEIWIAPPPARRKQGHARPAALVRVLYLAVLLAAPLGARPQEATDAPGKSPEVLLVSSLERKLLSAVVKEIRKEVPGVRFRSFPDEARLFAGIRSGAVVPDVYFGTSTALLARLARRGFLQARDVAFAARLPVGLADRDRRWYGVLGDPLAILYNGDYFAEEALKPYLPEAWADLALPRYRGSLLLEYPAPYNATGYLFACLVDRAEREEGDRRKGFTLLEGLERNLYRVSGEEPAFRTRAWILSTRGLFSGGAGSITVAPLREVERLSEEGLPVEFIQPREGLVIHPRGLAIENGAGPQARRVFDLLADEAFLVRFARRGAFVPLASGGSFTLSVWPGEPTTFDVMHSDHDAVLRNLEAWLGEWQSLYRGRTRGKLRAIDDALNTTMTFLIPAALLFLIYRSHRRSRKGHRSKNRPST